MGTYRPLYSICVEHEYFDQNICCALQCRVSPVGQVLLSRRNLLFRQTATNLWTILYDDSGAGPDTRFDVLALELEVSDPAFVLYTQWDSFTPSSSYQLLLPIPNKQVEATDAIVKTPNKRRIGATFCTILLHLTEEVCQVAQVRTPQICQLLFHAPEKKWEYIFIQRSEKDISIERLRLETNSDIIYFEPFELREEYGRNVLRTVSKNKIPMREYYSFQLNLNLVSIAEGNNQQKQVFLRNIELPIAGVYLSNETDILRQVCYF